VTAPIVAALYVERGGAYWDDPRIDPWDEERDARLYAGPLPVIAHPPCTRWSILGTCRGYYDGQDEGCFEAALAAVRRFGGVLEHPAHTLAWKSFGLARPASLGWTRSLLDDGWTCLVDQRHYGHRARKPTWLYYIGPEPPQLTWGRGPRGRAIADSHHGDGTDRSGSPPAFREALIALALTGSPAPAGASELASTRPAAGGGGQT
jgi:hypothetical protein